MGRTKGGSVKQRKMQALIAEGMPPLEAARQAGYAYPGHELKRQVADIAKARGADPMGVLCDVLRYGSTADKISAAAAILATEEARDDEGAGALVFIVREVVADDDPRAQQDGFFVLSQVPPGHAVHNTAEEAIA